MVAEVDVGGAERARAGGDQNVVATQPGAVMILDTGLLGTNTLGASGLSDPATVLILGTSLLDTGILGY